MDEEEKLIEARMQQLLDLDKELAEDAINYINIQVNEDSKIGKINEMEYRNMVLNATRGLMRLIFIHNYSRDLTLRYAFSKAATNFLILKYTLVLGGHYTELVKKKYESQQPIRVSN